MRRHRLYNFCLLIASTITASVAFVSPSVSYNAPSQSTVKNDVKYRIADVYRRNEIQLMQPPGSIRRHCLTRQLSLAATTSSTSDESQFSRVTSQFIERCNNLPFILQTILVIAIYLFHLLILTRHQITLPFQLIPNSHGHFTSIGLDSLAGIATLFAYIRAQRKSQSTRHRQTLPAALRKPKVFPWILPDDNQRQRSTSLITAGLLVQAYFWTGRFSLFWEDLLYSMSGLGWPLTVAMHRSMCVLLGHLSWVAVGVLILKFIPRPPRFFGGTRASDNDATPAVVPTARRNWKWFSSSIRANWIWWTIGGYFVTSTVFDLADLLNQYVLPQAVLDNAQESVVSQLVNPEHNEVAASVVGYIAPCLSAPWWEEILYRGFLLSALSQAVGYPWAVFLQGIVFSAHHMSLTAALPLAVLGWTWAQIYSLSGNMFTVMFIHALWNSRVFIGSWFGL